MGLQLSEIATVETIYGYAQPTTLQDGYSENRGDEEVLGLCEAHGIPLILYFYLIRSIPKPDDKLTKLAHQHSISEVQLNLAWLLHKSSILLPISNTSSLAHLRENLVASTIKLSAEMAYLERV